MAVIDEYYEDENLPEGFREALSKNGKALQFWCAMTEQERQQRLGEVKKLRAPQEIEEYVNEIVGWEKGHPPYQL